MWLPRSLVIDIAALKSGGHEHDSPGETHGLQRGAGAALCAAIMFFRLSFTLFTLFSG